MLLLDEPLGALDLKLRQEMQLFLKELQRELGMTFIYVTHDQEEALTMSDRSPSSTRAGSSRSAAPAEVYDRPATEFVAGFVGTSNILERDGRRFCVRPERISFAGEAGEPATITDVVFVGAFTRYLVETDEGEQLDGRPAGRPRADRAAASRFGSPGATRMPSSYRQDNRRQ